MCVYPSKRSKIKSSALAVNSSASYLEICGTNHGLKAVMLDKESRVYCIKKKQDATLAVLFINHCKITLHVSGAFYVHHQEY